ncbi:MAG: metalloregulator ArsR/SmtB family transcription factor [Deltaproteobacteria bacterium]|nr:metalloregulator ArsR/SmtB family transcription factor [Deltaproteobacteria bacterium]
MKILNYFKALADETRIRLFNILIDHELSVNELVFLMDMGQSRISRHLKILTDSGLLQCRRDGVWAFYSVSRDGKEKEFAEAVRFLFDDETLLAEDLKRAEIVIDERKKKSKQFFNRIAHEWDDLQQQIIGDFDLNTAILKHVEKCDFAVDMGCGTGKLLFLLKDLATVAVGVDSSPEMLEQARALFNQENGNVNLRLGELEHLPVRDNEADYAIISMALHHLSDPSKAIEEAARILDKKGKLIIADFEKHQDENMREKYGDRWLGFSKEEILTFLSGNGFSLIDTESFTMNHALKLNIYKSEKI